MRGQNVKTTKEGVHKQNWRFGSGYNYFGNSFCGAPSCRTLSARGSVREVKRVGASRTRLPLTGPVLELGLKSQALSGSCMSQIKRLLVYQPSRGSSNSSKRAKIRRECPPLQEQEEEGEALHLGGGGGLQQFSASGEMSLQCTEVRVRRVPGRRCQCVFVWCYDAHHQSTAIFCQRQECRRQQCLYTSSPRTRGVCFNSFTAVRVTGSQPGQNLPNQYAERCDLMFSRHVRRGQRGKSGERVYFCCALVRCSSPFVQKRRVVQCGGRRLLLHPASGR